MADCFHHVQIFLGICVAIATSAGISVSLLQNCSEDCSVEGEDGGTIDCWVKRMSNEKGMEIISSSPAASYYHLPSGPRTPEILLNPNPTNTSLHIVWAQRLPMIEKLRHFLLCITVNYMEDNTPMERAQFFLFNFNKTLSRSKVGYKTKFGFVCSSYSDSVKDITAEVWSLPRLRRRSRIPHYRAIINEHSYSKSSRVLLDMGFRKKYFDAMSCMCYSKISIETEEPYVVNDISVYVTISRWPSSGTYQIQLFRQKPRKLLSMDIHVMSNDTKNNNITISAVHRNCGSGEYVIKVTGECPDSYRHLVPSTCETPIVETKPFKVIRLRAAEDSPLMFGIKKRCK